MVTSLSGWYFCITKKLTTKLPLLQWGSIGNNVGFPQFVGVVDGNSLLLREYRMGLWKNQAHYYMFTNLSLTFFTMDHKGIQNPLRTLNSTLFSSFATTVKKWNPFTPDKWPWLTCFLVASPGRVLLALKETLIGSESNQQAGTWLTMEMAAISSSTPHALM